MKPSTLLYISNSFSLFILGTINNFSYVVIASAAQDIAFHFHQEKRIGLVPWANICMGLLFQIGNGLFLQGVPHSYRILFACAMHLLGLIGLGLSVWLQDWGFWISLLCIMAIGASATFGEIVILGYLKVYGNDIVSAFSSGTGMAGVAGSFTYLIMGFIMKLFISDSSSDNGSLGLSLNFFSFTPLVVIYAFFWFVMLREPKEIQGGGDEEGALGVDNTTKDADLMDQLEGDADSIEQTPVINSMVPSDSSPSAPSPVPNANSSKETDTLLPKKPAPLTHQTSGYDPQVTAVVENPAYEGEEYIIEEPEHSWTHTLHDTITSLARSFKLCWWRSSNLLLVYLFEYVISIGCANAATAQYKNSDIFFEKYAFRILGFCYQFGVLISRSSLKVIKIRRVSLITLLQGLMLLFWLVEGKLRFLPVYVLFPMMVFVGLLGGSSYVQIFYLLISDKRMTPKEREYCVNICAICVTIGITLSSLVIMVLSETLYSDIE